MLAAMLGVWDCFLMYNREGKEALAQQVMLAAMLGVWDCFDVEPLDRKNDGTNAAVPMTLDATFIPTPCN